MQKKSYVTPELELAAYTLGADILLFSVIPEPTEEFEGPILAKIRDDMADDQLPTYPSEP